MKKGTCNFFKSSLSPFKCVWESGCKPDSVPVRPCGRSGGGHFSGTRIAPGLVRPTRGSRPGRSSRSSTGVPLLTPSYLALLQVTLAGQPCRHDRGGLLPRLFTLACSDALANAGHRRCAFCCAGVGSLRLGVTQHPALGVRTFLRPLARPATTCPTPTREAIIAEFTRL